jgi:hypothetical protein
MITRRRRRHVEEAGYEAFPNAILTAVGLLLMLSGGCGPKAGIRQSPEGPDLADRFILITPPDRNVDGQKRLMRHEHVVRNGLARDAMVLVAPATIRMPVDGISGAAILEALSAPVYNLGDGMQMDILLSGSGHERLIYSRYYDAGRRLEDRAWIPLAIPLDPNGGPEDAQLEIRVSGGPQGDLVADWLALSAMRIVPRHASQ